VSGTEHIFTICHLWSRPYPYNESCLYRLKWDRSKDWTKRVSGSESEQPSTLEDGKGSSGIRSGKNLNETSLIGEEEGGD